jgi:hypothetical protein
VFAKKGSAITRNIVRALPFFWPRNIVKNIGHPEWFVPAFIFIDGADFIPLAKAFQQATYGDWCCDDGLGIVFSIISLRGEWLGLEVCSLQAQTSLMASTSVAFPTHWRKRL